jgi:hypothetical protein
MRASIWRHAVEDLRRRVSVPILEIKPVASLARESFPFFSLKIHYFQL